MGSNCVYYLLTSLFPVQSLEEILQAAGSAINEGSLRKAQYLLKNAV